MPTLDFDIATLRPRWHQPEPVREGASKDLPHERGAPAWPILGDEKTNPAADFSITY